MKPIPIRLAPPVAGRLHPEPDEDMNVDALLEESGKAARLAVDRGDGGVGEIAMWMDSLRLAMFAIAIAVRDQKGGCSHD
jgi:hypothetical protein